MKRVLLLTLTIVILMTAAGCNNRDEKVQDDLKSISQQYLYAEYSGDVDKLRQLTTEEAWDAVERGDIQIFEEHKLESIPKINIVEQDAFRANVIVTVSSQANNEEIPTNYFENLTLTKIDGKWTFRMARGVSKVTVAVVTSSNNS